MTINLPEALDIVLEDIEPTAAARLKAAFTGAALDSLETKRFFKAIDRTILTDNGGFAFQWKDVLALDDILKTLDTEDLLSVLSPDILAAIAFKVLGMWCRIRRFRVELTKKEFIIIRSIKRGKQDVKSISKHTGIEPEGVASTLENLTKRRYREDTPLVEQEGVKYSTNF